MTIDRTARVKLDASEPRCHPLANPRAMGALCARRVAPIVQGSPLTDFSLGTNGGTDKCLGYIAAAAFRWAPDVVEPRVHPPMGEQA
jgi:hypothetical protein